MLRQRLQVRPSSRTVLQQKLTDPSQFTSRAFAPEGVHRSSALHVAGIRIGSLRKQISHHGEVRNSGSQAVPNGDTQNGQISFVRGRHRVERELREVVALQTGYP